MSLFEAKYPEIEQTRFEIEARIKHLEDKLFARKNISEQINHEELQYNITNLYNMMKETADNQVLLHKELAHLRSEVSVDHSVEARINKLQASRREAEDKAFLLQKQLDAYNLKQQKDKLYGYDALVNKRPLDLQMDARINMYKASLQQDSRRIYENRLLHNALSQQQLQLQQLKRDRQAFQRSYRNLSAHDLMGSSSANKYQTNSFSGSFYGRTTVGDRTLKPYYDQPNTDYKYRNQDSRQASRKQQEAQTQPSPQKIKNSYDGKRLQDRQLSDKKYYYRQAHDNEESLDDKNNNRQRRNKYGKQSNRDERRTLDINDLQPKSNDNSDESAVFGGRRKYQQDSNSDSLQRSKRSGKKLVRSNSLQGSINKRSASKKSPQKKGNISVYDKYSNIKRKQKSPSKKRKQVQNQNQTRKNVFERIQNRIVHAWAIYQDSTFRNTKHQKDHLFNTYALETRLRNEMRDKLQSHPIVQHKFGFIVE